MHGDVLELVKDNKGGGDLTSGTVCIKTTIQDLIWVSIPVLIDNEIVTIRIRESTYYPWDIQGYDKEKGEPESTREREEGENLEEEEEESERESDREGESGEGESGEDFYEDSASFLHEGEHEEDLEDYVESKLVSEGDQEDEELHTPSAEKLERVSGENIGGRTNLSNVLSSSKINIQEREGGKVNNIEESMKEEAGNRKQGSERSGTSENSSSATPLFNNSDFHTPSAAGMVRSLNSVGSLCRQEVKKKQEGDSNINENVEGGADISNLMFPRKNNNTEGGEGKQDLSQSIVENTQEVDEIKEKRTKYTQVRDGDGTGAVSSSMCKPVTEGADRGVKMSTQQSFQKIDRPQTKKIKYTEDDLEDSRKNRTQEESVGNYNALIDKNVSAVNQKEKIDQDREGQATLSGGLMSSSKEVQAIQTGGIFSASKEDSRKNKNHEESEESGVKQYNALIDKNVSAVNQEEKNDQERKVQETLSRGIMSSSKEVQAMQTEGVISSPKEVSRKNKNQEESEESAVKQSQKGLNGSTADPSYNQLTEGEESRVKQSQIGQNGSAAVPSYNQQIEGVESGVKQSQKGQFGSTAAPSYNQLTEGEELGSKESQKGQNGYTAAPPSYNVNGDNHSRNEEKSSNTAKPKREKADPVMGKKKRKPRFVDNNLSPIRTRHSLQKTKAEGSKSSKDMDGIPLSLESSIRALRKKDREVNGLRIQYPERVLVPIPSGDADNDSEEIRIGKACGFFKSVKNAESKKGLDYWV